MAHPDFSEVWFPGEFTTYHPSRGQIPNTYTTERGIVPVAGPSWEPPFDKTFSFPITRVVHMTHTPEKLEIFREIFREFCDNPDLGPPLRIAQFKPQPKFSRGNTFKYMQDSQSLVPLNFSSIVLPGKYVWFGMKPSLPVDIDFEQLISDVEWASKRSRYGPWVFDLLYHDLINIYEHYITKYHASEQVCFRNGGTLRYRCEICYVVIITHTGDEYHSKFPMVPFRAKPIFFSGDLTTPPRFYPQCVPVTKLGYTWDHLKDWDHVVFAVHCDWEGTFDIPARSLIPLGKPYDLFDGVPFELWDRIHGLCIKTLPRPSQHCLLAEMEYRQCHERQH